MAGFFGVSCWLARVMTVGPARSEWRSFSSRFVQRVAELLSVGDVPVGFHRVAGELTHPVRTAAAIKAAQVGYVARSWYDGASMSLFALLEVEAEQVRRELELHERDRRLHVVGVSPLFAGDPVTHDLGLRGLEYVDVRGVLSVDFVSRPDGVGCHVLRSVVS